MFIMEMSRAQGISVEFSQVAMQNSVTPLDETNPFWLSFETATAELCAPAKTRNRF